MKKRNYTKSKITLLLSLIFLVSIVVVSYTQANNQYLKQANSECWVCDDSNGCDYGEVTEEGAYGCHYSVGWCFLSDGCCGDCDKE